MEQALTKSQRELVELNHNLIYKFIYDKNLAIDEYYDILAIGLCNAAKIFDNSVGKFSTLAYQCMNNELSRYLWHNISRKSAVPNNMVISYDAPIDSNDNESYLNYLSDNNNSLCDMVVNNIILKDFINSLSHKEQKVVRLTMLGMGQKEIAEVMNCTRQNISLYLRKIQKKYYRLYS